MSQGFGPDETGDDERVSVDLSAVRADDALLDALGGSDPKIADELGAAELNAVLLSWSREVDSEPMPELVDADTAMATIRQAARSDQRDKRDRRFRLLVPVAAAAAVLAVTFGGASIAAHDAQPGDTLWGLTKVLYTEKANSVQASYDVKAEFKVARDALDEGEFGAARDALEKASSSLREVREEENRAGLSKQHTDLMTKLDESDDIPPVSEDDESADETPSTSEQTPSEDSSTETEAPETSPEESSSAPESSTSTPEPEPSSSSSAPTSSSSSSGSASGDGSRTTEDEPDAVPGSSGGVSGDNVVG